MRNTLFLFFMICGLLLGAQELGTSVSRPQEELPLGWSSGNNFFDDGGFFPGDQTEEAREEREQSPPQPRPVEPQRPRPSTRDITDIVRGIPDGTIIPPQDDNFEKEVLRLTNQERQNNGLSPLVWDDSLANAARYHAADMAVENYFDHASFDRNGGQLVQVAGTWERIRAFAQGAGAENIAAGYSTPGALVTGWMNSPGHRANILTPSLKRLGVGIYSYAGSGYGTYGVQNFGY